MITVLILCAVSGVLIAFTYTLGMYLESAGRLDRPTGGGEGFTVVFVVPCLNEERVIGATLRRLIAVSPPDALIVVVDDGSDDGTADLVGGFTDPRVRLLRRVPPDARHGKGEALNHAVRFLLDGGALRHRAADRVLVCLMDADGRLDPESLAMVLPYFADPRVGAAQVGVRIANKAQSTLARLQDMEFVVYTHLFQRTRGRVGCAGLGGNGQFMRLSALLDLGDDPWSRSLTEDLDLGVRLVLAGWRTECVWYATVRQQGLVSLRALVRQRSRWFQGHVQAWRLVPSVVGRASGRVAADLLNVLLSPLLIFIGSFMTMSLLAALAGAALSEPAREQLFRPLPIVSWYVLTFAPAFLAGPLYARVSGDLRWVRGLVYGHLFVLYNLVWLVAGWWGTGRMVIGRRSWLKTDRLTDREAGPAPAGTAPGST
ncbi:cellulose synthase/poly-beta-1,6-N-acetylglucosamine synthase-like glycosyltransferase [Streptosporangium becharense]|uniref:Cellulose synthase/poly-beta-1,6-N-acetylglucosamine synthase-like glycosyltransferase n=1 Tax=Streptosporangium becharense TaxID=1816182 RepID=A0A7W9IMC5_9ACTN|nr:glycosyltransferase family 2 protein [Streptosporangium becharense]MBB2914539.1 cellulose synthase/poly-beta-1,6-N-acetylglucosamine synthase-like glycosyltransferase [Streptosporangium becharense]MBB5823384.1 cellulose synthase/poly-beta-1,6-N-acetylglucosamine synthase-like glycosyltransferase [Streptosporangium becharense]